MNRYLDIYQFTHFRKFLEEYQVARAKEEPGFTRTEICNLLGLEKSRSYFADVVRGKKVSPRMVQKFIEILELDKKEAKYFETLVELDQAKNESIRNAAMQELLKQHPNPQHIMNEDAYEYYSHWYNSALFAILDAMDVDDDMAPVQKRIFPKVPLGKLKDSLALLERLGLARKNENGFWKPALAHNTVGSHGPCRQTFEVALFRSIVHRCKAAIEMPHQRIAAVRGEHILCVRGVHGVVKMEFQGI